MVRECSPDFNVLEKRTGYDRLKVGMCLFCCEGGCGWFWGWNAQTGSIFILFERCLSCANYWKAVEDRSDKAVSLQRVTCMYSGVSPELSTVDVEIGVDSIWCN